MQPNKDAAYIQQRNSASLPRIRAEVAQTSAMG